MKSLLKRALSLTIAIVMVIGVAVTGGVPTVFGETDSYLYAKLTVTLTKEASGTEDPEYAYAASLWRHESGSGPDTQITEGVTTTVADPDADGTAESTVAYDGITFSLSIDSEKVAEMTALNDSQEKTVELKFDEDEDLGEKLIGGDSFSVASSVSNVDATVSYTSSSADITVDNSGNVTIPDTVDDNTEFTVTASIKGTSETVYATKTYTFTARTAYAVVSDESVLPTETASSYNDDFTMILKFNGVGLTEDICKEKAEEVLNGGNLPKPVFDSGSLKYTFSANEGERKAYSFTFNNTDYVIDIDKTELTAAMLISSNDSSTISVDITTNHPDAGVEYWYMNGEDKETITPDEGTDSTTDEMIKAEFTFANSDQVPEEIFAKITSKTGNSLDLSGSVIKNITVVITDVEDGKGSPEIDTDNIYFSKNALVKISNVVAGATVKVGENENAATYLEADSCYKFESEGTIEKGTEISISIGSDEKSGSRYSNTGLIEKNYIVDKVAPTVLIGFDEKVQGYTKDGENGTLYLRLTDIITANHDGSISGKNISLTLTGKVDKEYYDSNDIKNNDINSTIDCPKNAVTEISIDQLSVFTGVKSMSKIPAVVKLIDGNGVIFGVDNLEKIIVDRKAPVGGSAADAPAHVKINITSDPAIENTNYYKNSLSFNLSAYDDTGVASMHYWLEDADDELMKSIPTEATKAEYSEGDITLSFKQIEDKKVILWASATDNAGNTSYDQYEFAVDNKAPEKEISFYLGDYSNAPDSKNDLRVKVADAFFDPENTFVTLTARLDGSDDESCNYTKKWSELAAADEWSLMIGDVGYTAEGIKENAVRNYFAYYDIKDGVTVERITVSSTDKLGNKEGPDNPDTDEVENPEYLTVAPPKKINR